MAKHYREFHDQSVVHCIAPAGNDYTLCGDALEGEDGDTPMKPTRDPIRCDRCSAIINFSKKVAAKEIHPDFR